ncbi:MAG: hypothetical protein ABIJ37_04200 [Pseudomonadota bacterium]
MRKTILAVSLALIMVFISLMNAGAEEAKATVSASVDVFNKYVFRGYELSANSIVIQPALNLCVNKIEHMNYPANRENNLSHKK